ncbi:MAG: YitT family protein [Lachnospiraceae bacterium]|nr:YitT family protein [Ruminococcus sp.]MCM1273798.1 YitT family protein [Lachnospiraceae bacterium]
MGKASIKKTVLRWVLDILIILLGSAVYALGVHCFITPNKIAPGGVTGIAVLVSELTELKVGTLILLLNVPLIIAGFFLLNKGTMVKTLISVAVITVVTDLAETFVPIYTAADNGGGILAAIFGGVLMGVGLGLNYQREGTSGGSDILVKIIIRFVPDLKISVIQAVFDGIVVLFGMFVYNDVNVVLLAVISIVVTSKCIDMLVYGSQQGRFLLIFSSKPEEITKRIIEQDHGVTLLKGEGAFSGEERQVVATAVHRSAYSKVKRIVKEIDPKAFVVTTTAGEVLGEGFTTPKL